MKKRNTSRFGKLFAVAVLGIACALLLTLLAVPAFAEDTAETNMENVLSYDGLSARTKGYGGIRSVYTVDRDAVTALEDAGYSVAYGAVMGVGTYKGATVNTTRALAVNGNFANGFTAASNNAAAVVVYATGSPNYVKGIHLDNTNTSFAYTTTYAEADAAKYGIELVYTGFVSVTDAQGNQTIVYDYAEGGLFGSDASTYGAATSLSELADWFVNEYDSSAVKAYHYNTNATLRNVLTTCDKEIRTLQAPVTLTEIADEVSLAKTLPTSYVTAARAAYKTAEYADYTTSIVANYSTAGSAYNDRPVPVTISWTNDNGEVLAYTLTLATDADFTQNVRVIASNTTSADVYNLYTSTTYYFKVEAVTADGYSYETAVSSFKTADTVRWIYVDGVRNVRDLGGWNGLNQGLVYRGSELNLVGSHGLQITDAGVDMMVNTLGVKTDLDFRGTGTNELGDCSTNPPLGDSVAWTHRSIGNFLSAFSSSYGNVLKLFADPDNYPFYMHCWGGADRTGTVALMLQGMCGVSEEDLAIDLEQTSFSIFGYRYRYDNGNYLYASTIAKIKTDFEGDTLQDKFEAYALSIGLTRAEISNIQSMLSGTGVAFDPAYLSNLVFDGGTDETITVGLRTPNGQTVVGVTVDGVAVNFTFADGILTLSGTELIAKGVNGGDMVILMSDGQSLCTYVEQSLWLQIANGDYTKFFNEGTVTVDGNTIVKDSGGVNFTHEALRSLYDAGYTSVSFRVTADMTGPVSDSDARIRLLARWAIYGTPDYLAGDKQDVTLSSVPGVATAFMTIHLTEEFLGEGNYFVVAPQSGENLVLKNFVLCKNGEAPVEPEEPTEPEDPADPNLEFVEAVNGGAYDKLFPTGTLTTDENGNPVQVIESGNFVVSKDVLAKALAAGYSYITFKVEVEMPEGVTEGFICVRMNGQKYETKYAAFRTTDGHIYALATLPISESTTTLQFISRADYTVDGSVNTSSHDQVNATFTFCEVAFLQSGSEGATVVEEPTKTTVERIVEGEYALLFTTTTTVENGAVTAPQIVEFSHDVLMELYEAGYTSISFHVVSELTAVADSSGRVRVVARWTTGGSNYISNSDKQDIDLNKQLGTAERTLTFHLTEEFLGDTNYIRLHAQTGDAITFTDFVFSK